MRTLILILLTLSLQVPVAYGAQCKQLLSKESIELEGLGLLDKLERALKNLPQKGVEVTKAEVLEFKKKGSSFRSLQKITSGRQTLRVSFWYVIENRLFNKPPMETLEIVRRVESLYDIFLAEFLGDKMQDFFKVAKGNKNSYQAKRKVIAELKKYSSFFSELLSRDVNLLREKDFLDLFEVSQHSDLKARSAALKDKNKALNIRIQKFLGSEAGQGRNIFSRLSVHFLGTNRPTFHMADHSFFTKGPLLDEVRGLIKQLHLPHKSEQAYLRSLDIFKKFFQGDLNKTTEHMGYTLVLFKAFEEIFGDRHREILHQNRNLSSQAFLNVKIKIQQAEHVRIVIDAQMEGYVKKSDELNARISNIRDTAKKRASRFTKHAELYMKFDQEAKALKVRDFDENLTEIERELSRLELELDGATEAVLKEVRNENIEYFDDLNNRWGRLLPDKKYTLEGDDFGSVSFSPEVIEAFKNDVLLGSRYLTALSKSYVPMVNASGLRSLPKIHRQFRDVKTMRSGGKIRIVGKLIEGHIYFFNIYKSEKPYVIGVMKSLVDNYTP